MSIACSEFSLTPQKNWFAVRTLSRHEKVVRDRLRQQGIDHILPLHTRVSQWKDRRKTIEHPLFPGYCFANFVPQDKLAVLQLPGVMYVVSNQGQPIPVPLEEIEALRRLTASGVEYEPHPYLPEGSWVTLTRGPLAGLRGRLLRRQGHCYVLVGIQLLQQGATVRVDVNDVTLVH